MNRKHLLISLLSITAMAFGFISCSEKVASKPNFITKPAPRTGVVAKIGGVEIDGVDVRRVRLRYAGFWVALGQGVMRGLKRQHGAAGLIAGIFVVAVGITDGAANNASRQSALLFAQPCDFRRNAA